MMVRKKGTGNGREFSFFGKIQTERKGKRVLLYSYLYR
jgi:hypothetical protein